MYSVIYSSDVDMVGKRDFKDGKGKQENPLKEKVVTVRRVSTVQACGNETYSRVMTRKNPSWTPSADYTAWWKVSTDNDCIVEHKTKGTRYLRGLPKGVTVETYFVNGTEATETEAETIRKFKEGSGKDAEFVLLNLEKLENVKDEEA